MPGLSESLAFFYAAKSEAIFKAKAEAEAEAEVMEETKTAIEYYKATARVASASILNRDGMHINICNSAIFCTGLQTNRLPEGYEIHRRALKVR